MQHGIEEYVKDKHPSLHTLYSIDRLVFNKSTGSVKIQSGFNIDDFINEQKTVVSQASASFKLNVKKYKVMKEANDTLKNNKPVPVKLHAFNHIMRTNEKLLSKDPWYYIILKTLATLTASILTVGFGSFSAYRFFFGNNSTKSKTFLRNIKPDLEQISSHCRQ